MTDDSPRIAFFGTSDISVQSLHHLHDAGLTPSLIVTSASKRKGRGLISTPSPVKIWATTHHVPVIEPLSFETIPRELTETRDEKKFDLFVVVSYGYKLPEDILDIPLHGALNMHPSLLPKLRGASPIQSAILEDMRETGVTIMRLDDIMDHGPIVAQSRVDIEKNDWPLKASVLEKLLGDIGGALLAETILPWINGDIMEEKQNDDEATYCRKFTKDDGQIDLTGDPYKNYLTIRAFDVWPGTYFFVNKGNKKIRVKITDALFEDGTLTITRVIPEGKKEMDYEDFKRGL